MTTRAIPEPGGDMGKLPKWAREHIAMLQQRLRDAYDARDALLPDAVGSSDVVLVEMVDYPYPNRPLPSHAGVRFMLRERPGGMSDYIEVSRRMDSGRVVVDVRGSGTIHIEPRAANAVYVR